MSLLLCTRFSLLLRPRSKGGIKLFHSGDICLNADHINTPFVLRSVFEFRQELYKSSLEKMLECLELNGKGLARAIELDAASFALDVDLYRLSDGDYGEHE